MDIAYLKETATEYDDGVYLIGKEMYYTGNGTVREIWSEDDNASKEIETAYIGDRITEIDDFAFYGCKKLTTVHIPSSVKKIGQEAFAYCKSLRRIVIPESVQKIGDFAFSHCDFLSEVKLPEKVRLGEDVFRECNSLFPEKVDMEQVRCNAVQSGSCGNGFLWYRVENDLYIEGEGVLPARWEDSEDTIHSLKMEIKRVMINPGCTEVEKETFEFWDFSAISIPTTVRKIGSRAFFCCEKLRSIDVPACEIVGQQAFSFCKMLEYVDMPRVKIIGHLAFDGCTQIRKMIISPNVSHIDPLAFDNIPEEALPGFINEMIEKLEFLGEDEDRDC